MTRHRPKLVHAIALGLALSSLWISLEAVGRAQEANAITIITEDGRRSLPISEFSGVQMVPLGAVANLVGATLRPGSQRGSVIVSSGGKLASLSDGKNFVYVRDKLELLQSPARQVSGEWFVSLDFLSKVLPELADVGVAYRPQDRTLVLGDAFPRLEVQSEYDPAYTRVTVSTSREVPIAVDQSYGRIRLTIQTPYLETDFDGEELRDGVVDTITLERGEDRYLVTVNLGERFGRLQAVERERSVVLDLLRSRVPTARSRPGETEIVPEDLRPVEERASEGSEGEDPTGAVEEEPDAGPEVVELPSDFGIPDPAEADRILNPEDPAQLRIVTVDPGHGGAETGAEGSTGLVEKDVVLSIARRFRSLLQERLGLRVILTRDGDRDLDLDDRAEIANNNKSDLFISIHADASPRRVARGSSVYFLSYSSSGAERVRTQSRSANGGDLEFILWDMAQASHLNQSSQLAEILQEELLAATGSDEVNRGIKQNTFRVLRGATMPAVLVEVGFISNPEEEELLSTAEYQEKLAEALYRGVLRYKDLYENGPRAERASRGRQ